MQAFVLLIGVLMWLFYSVNEQPMLYKAEHVTASQSEELAPKVAPLQRAFDAAHRERKASMLALAQVEGGVTADPVALKRYQDAVAGVDEARRDARILVHDTVDEAGKAQDDKDTNNIFCQFILAKMPPLLLGLIIAAIFAAAMSSIDSVLNSLSGATVVDIYRRWIKPGCDDAHALRVGKFITLFWGVIATFTALFFAGGGSIIEMINRVGSWFYGSLLGIFVMALFMRRAGDLAGALGLLGGMGAVLVVHNTVKVEFLWYNVVGLVGVEHFGRLGKRRHVPHPRAGGAGAAERPRHGCAGPLVGEGGALEEHLEDAQLHLHRPRLRCPVAHFVRLPLSPDEEGSDVGTGIPIAITR